MRFYDDDGAPLPWLLKALIVCMIIQFILTFFLPSGCGHTGPLPAPPSPAVSQTPCDGNPYPIDTDVCDGKFTVEGNPCVRCDVPRGCFAMSIGAYCTPSCSDRECSFGGGR